MHLRTSIRYSVVAGLAGLLCLAAPGVSNAQTDSATPRATSHATSPAKKKHSARHASATHRSSKSGKSSKGKKSSRKKRGQQAIDSSRTREIQEALIREHYLQGEPSGTWDAASHAAMQKYQADNGWQSKTTPDSRALIKLGLGPNHDRLLNPESAMTSAPAAASAKPAVKKTDPAQPQQ